MTHTITLPNEIENIYKLAAEQLNLSVEDFIQETLIDYIITICNKKEALC
jgi:hypothetical protein